MNRLSSVDVKSPPRITTANSTVTQQLARQRILTPDETIRRKLTEVVVAARS